MNSQARPTMTAQLAAIFNAGVFLNIANRLNTSKDHDRTAECSNFTYHAVGTFLLNQDIRKEYNVFQIGIMQKEALNKDTYESSRNRAVTEYLATSY